MINRHNKVFARRVSARIVTPATVVNLFRNAAVRVVVIALLLGASMHSAVAQTAITWSGAASGGNSGWTRNANWQGTAPVAGNALVFTGSTRLTANNNDITAGTLFFSISFGANAGAFTLAGNSLSLSNGITNNSANTQTFALAGIALSNSQTFNAAAGALVFTNTNSISLNSFTLTVDGGFNTTINSIVSGTGVLAKTGAGTLLLTNVNTYSGATVLSAGVLRAGNNAAVGTGTLVLNGGTFSSDGGTARTITNAITMSNNVTLGDSVGTGTLTFSNVNLNQAARTFTVSNATTIAGVISNGGAIAASLVKSGAGTLNLSGANTYGGTTTIGAGVLAITNGSAIADSGTVSLSNIAGATFLVSGSETIGSLQGGGATGGNVSIATGQALTVAETNSQTFAGLITNAGSFVKIGAGTLILGNAANTYGGTTTIGGGVLSAGTLANAGANSSIGTNATIIITNGGVLDYSGATTSINRGINLASGNGGLGVSNSAAALTISGVISNTGALAKTGAGTLVLSGANTYSGTTTINVGALNIQTSSGLGVTNAGTTVASGAALELQGNISIGAEALGISGTGIGNTGALRNISGTNTYGGAITLNADSVIESDANSLLNLTGAIGGNFVKTFDGPGNISASGAIGGTTGVVKTGAGTLNLSGANTYGGTTTIGGGVLAITNGSAIADSGTVTLSNIAGATFLVSGSETIGSLQGGGATGGNVSIASGQALTVAETGSQTFAGLITNSGSFIKTGAGTLTLSGANTYSGGTTIAGGALSVGADNNLGSAPGSPTAGSLTFSNGTLLLTSGFALNANRGISLGTGGGTINVASGQAASYSGSMAGSGNFTKSGAGTLTLSASNSYNGTTTLSAGTLRAANTSALGTAVAGDALTLNGGRLELASDTNATFGPTTGYGTTIGGNVTIAVDRLSSGAATSAQLGTLSIGAQTLTVERGTNATSGTAALVIGGATTLSGNSTFATAANTELRFNETLAGAFNITKTGDGILTLNRGGGQADNTITAGQLNINHFQALGTSPGTLFLSGGVTIDNTSGAFLSVGNAKSISLGSTLTFLGSSGLNLGSGTTTLTNNTAINVVTNTLTLGGDVIGAFGLTKNGIGTLELAGLTGTNSFTGNSFINAGELFLSGTSRFGGTSNTVVTIETNAFLRVGASAGLGNVSLVLNNPNGLILAGIITNDVVFSNSGTISSTYASVDGSITIGQGVTMTTAANNLGTIPTTNTPGRIVLDNNATLAATATFTINQNQGITLQPGTATFSPDTGVQVFIASSIAGGGELRKTGAGNIRLTGSNSYTGGTLIDQGIIGITSDSSLGAVSGRVKLNNGTLVAAQNNTGGPTNSGTTVNAGRTLVLGNGTTNNIDAQTGLFFEYNGVIGEENAAGAASAMRFGIGGTREGTVKLGGLNTYDGSTTIVAGTLQISNIANGGLASGIGQSGNAATNLIIGGTLRYAGANGTTDRLFSIGSSGVATIDSGSGSLAFTNTGSLGYAATNLIRHDLNLIGSGSGTISLALINDINNDPLHLTKSGSGTWTLLGANTYSGETTISGGTLQVGNGGTAGTLGSANVINNGTLLFNRSDNTTVGNTISGTGAVSKDGAGTLTITANNTYTGGFLLTGNGAVRAQNAGAFGSGLVQQSSGSSKLIIDTTQTVTNAMSIYNIATLQTVTLSGAKTLNNATYNVTNNTTTTETGLLSGTGGVTKEGTGTLIIAGTASNTFSGATVVNSGALVLSNSAGGALSGSNITVNAGASLILGSSDQIGDTTGLILNGGTFVVGTDTAGYSETLGTLTLNANSTIDLGSYATGLRQISFANSSGVAWGSNIFLTITNWQGLVRDSSDVAQLLFGPDGLNTTQLGQIYFANQNITGGTLIGPGGELVPIPEAEVYWAALAVLLAVGYRERRRLAQLARHAGFSVLLGKRAAVKIFGQ